MSPLLILAGFFLPLFGVTAWLQKRLRRAVAEQHPGTFRTIDNMVRCSPRSQRSLDRVTRYRMLQDPEIDRHILKLRRAELVFQFGLLAFLALVLVVMIVSAIRQ